MTSNRQSRRNKRSLWHPRHWPLWFGLGLLRLCVMLPYRLQLSLGAGLGRILYWGLGSRRRVAWRNLELCFPHWHAPERQQILRECFASVGIMILETGLAWWGRERRLRRLVQLSGLHHLDRAIEAGQGVLLIAAHFTTLEIGGRLLCLHRPEAKGALYREHGHPVLQWAVERYRGRYAGAIFARDQLRAAVKHLRQGKMLWFAPDQDYERGQSLFVPFFGLPAATTVSPHQLARLGRAQVLILRQRRLPKGRGYEIEVFTPPEPLPSDDVKHDCVCLNQSIEQLIQACPGQYLWLHRRFKNRPPGEPPLYD